MNQTIYDPIELEKIIAKISYYTEEEKQTLTTICMTMNTMTNYYKSINNDKFQTNITSVESQIPKLYNKRTNYIEVLRNILTNYEQYTQKTQAILNNITDDITDIVNTINKEV